MENERARASRDNRRPDQPDRAPSTPAILGKVTSNSRNIRIGHYLTLKVAKVFGAETEGSTPTFTDTTRSIEAYLAGTGVPLTGDYLLARFEGNRWIVERTNTSGDGGGIGSLPFCFCPNIPGTLAMTSADQNCNYQMFQSCTLQWMPTPPEFAPLNLGGFVYLSTQGFPDPLANNAVFYYYLTCQYNQFNLTRVYLTSPFGSPFRDGVLYSWLLGGYGNTCDPFHLDNGTSFPGGDLSCNVHIDGM